MIKYIFLFKKLIIILIVIVILFIYDIYLAFMNKQDAKPIVIRSTGQKNGVKIQTVNNNMKYNAGKNVQNKNRPNTKKIEEKIDEDDFSLPKVTGKLCVQLQQARLAKNMTQKQLAQACNMNDGIIRDYENGSAIPNPNDLVKMSKVLDVTLRNK